MSDAVIEALSAAREAHAAATEALLRAEDAARAAGVEVTPAAIDELTVKRINVVEDDGTLRIVIGNSTHGRRLPVRGRLVRHPGRNDAAGLLFMNDEGTECGGITFGGARGADGKEQVGYLAFDDYEQNESLRLGCNQLGDVSTKWLEFVDRPAWSIADLVEELEKVDPGHADEIQARHAAEGYGASRMRLAREEDGSVALVLRDGAGRDRLRLVVPADGEPVVEVVDAEGGARSLL
jgi:hypothetical protein